MNDNLKKITDSAKDAMEKSISHLEIELAKIRAGRANPSIFDNVQVDYYGSSVPISQVANINTQDARTIVIQPWEKSMLTPLEKAIQAANLGFNPQNDGVIIRIVVPPLTEERRKDLVKKAKQECEDAKVGIRSSRKDAMEACKKLGKEGVTEDEVKDAEAKIQQLTDSYVAKCDKHLELKEKEIMTV
jgi:ribosome recycling factor